MRACVRCVAGDRGPKKGNELPPGRRYAARAGQNLDLELCSLGVLIFQSMPREDRLKRREGVASRAVGLGGGAICYTAGRV